MPSRSNKNHGGGNGKNNNRGGRGGGRNNHYAQFNHRDRVNAGRIQSQTGSFNRGHPGNGFRTRGNFGGQLGGRIGNLAGGVNSNNSNGPLIYNEGGDDQVQRGPLSRTFHNHGLGLGPGVSPGAGASLNAGVYGRMEADGSFTPINPQQLLGHFMHPPAHRFGVFPPPRPPLLISPPGPLMTGPRFKSTSPPLKNLLCKFHATPGGCGHRARCNYMHEDFPCKFFHILGECKDQNLCKYSHEALIGSKKNALVMHVERAENGTDEFPRMARAEITAAIERVALDRSRERSSAISPNNNDSIPQQDSKPSTTDSAKINPFQIDSAGGHTTPHRKVQIQSGPASEIHILSETTKTIPSRGNDPNLSGNGNKSSVEQDEPSIHQIIQAMRRTLQQNEDSKKKYREKLEKENEVKARLMANSARSTRSNSSPNPNVQRISRTRPSLEKNQVQNISRSRNEQQSESKNNSGVNYSSFLTPADQDERFKLPTDSPPQSTASGQLLPFAQTHLDIPIFPSSSSISQGLHSLQNQTGRIIPTIDDVVNSCVGHGPPYTIWQTCQIYNTCAHHGLQVSINAFSDFQDGHGRLTEISHY